MSDTMPTDEQIAMDALRRIKKQAWKEGRKESIFLMKNIRAWATSKPMRQKDLIRWIDSAIENFDKETDEK